MFDPKNDAEFRELLKGHVDSFAEGLLVGFMKGFGEGFKEGFEEGLKEERKRTAHFIRFLTTKKGMSLQQVFKMMDPEKEEWELYSYLIEES